MDEIITGSEGTDWAREGLEDIQLQFDRQTGFVALRTMLFHK
jgi:hypothetical protein